MKNKYRILALLIFLLCVGCSSNNPYEEVTRKYNSPDGWDVSTVLAWNDKEYIMTININYNGKAPIRRVDYKPSFNGEFWPQGYIHPNINSYGWESENPEGDFPSDDLSRTIHKKCTNNVKNMTKEEAQNILNTTTISMKVFEANKSYEMELK